MPDQQVPQNPDPQTTGGNDQPQSAPVQGEATVSHKAYASLQTRYNTLNQAHADLQASFTALQTDRDALNATITRRNTEFADLQGQHATLQQTATQAQQTLLKYQAFGELLQDQENGLGLPPDAAVKLFGLLNDIPAGADLDATKAAIRKFADFGKSLGQSTEQRETAGTTPGTGDANSSPRFTTVAEWNKAAEKAAPGDNTFWSEFRAFVQSQNT